MHINHVISAFKLLYWDHMNVYILVVFKCAANADP